MLALPSLFIFFNKDLGISYTLLGGVLSARYIASGSSQILAGFLVDRYGAKLILICGLLLLVTASGLLAFVSSYWLILLIVVMAAVGDSVFHPADYTILNGSISGSRMGQAFSVHTFSGHLGFATAPVFITIVATQWDWRTAVLIGAGVGYVIVAVLITQWSSLNDDVISPQQKKNQDDTKREANNETMGDHARLLMSRPVLMLFAFFAMSTLASNGMHSFAIPALHALNDTSVVDAGFAVSTYMLVSSIAVLIGGRIADKIHHQERFAALAYGASIIAVLTIALLPLHYTLLVIVFGFVGFCHGVIRPARDLMVREVAPEGSTGKVFGFIFTGQNVGGAIAPIILGTVMDTLPPQWIFITTVCFMALCILTILSPRGPMTNRTSSAE